MRIAFVMAKKENPYEVKRREYIDRLTPLFLPPQNPADDIINYLASLLRVLGMEDRGWDPYAESRALLDDINSFFSVKLPKKTFPDPAQTHWRLGLVLYSHVVEMDAPYEVLANLLRFQLRKGYSPNPYFQFLKPHEQKSFSKRGMSTPRKIEIVGELSNEVGAGISHILAEFYDNKLRNAVAHADFTLTAEDFRCRGGLSGLKGFRIPYAQLDHLIMCAKAFASAFFYCELLTRRSLGMLKKQAVPYDGRYKGLLEILVDGEDAMCGFSVHWPNGTCSTYRRTDEGVEMINCMLDLPNSTLALWVGTYARNPGVFSPLVEHDAEPSYSPLDDSSTPLSWPANLVPSVHG